MEYVLLALAILAIPIGVLFAVLQVISLKERVAKLERDIVAVRSRAAQALEAATAKPTESITAPDSILRPPEPKDVAPLAPPPPPPVQPAPVSEWPEVAVRPQTPAPKSRSKQELEALVGGKLLNWIGALALIVGIGFFLKYAFDNNWISPTVRVLMGVVAGIGLLVFGKIMFDRAYRVFSQGIIGAGIATLYLAVYAAFNFYSLVSQPTAFVAMGLVTAIALYRGVAHDSQPIGILGWLGGFLTPFLLHSDVVNDVGFLVYVGLLAAGIQGIAYFKPSWVFLEYLNLGGTVVLFATWFANYYDSTKATTTTISLIVYWLILFGVELVSAVRGRLKTEAKYLLSGLIAIVFVVGLYATLHADYRYPLAVTMIIAGAVYAASGLVLSRRKSGDRQTTDFYTWYAMAYLVAATGVAVSEYRQVIALSGEAVILAWIASRWKNAAVRYATFVLLTLILLRFLFVPHMFAFEPIREFSLIINDRSVALISLIVSLFLGARWLSESDPKYGPNLRTALSVYWCLGIFLLVTFETLDYFRHVGAVNGQLPLATSPELTRNLTLALMWSALSAALITLGTRARAQVIIIAGLLAMEIGLVWALMSGWSYDPAVRFAVFFNYRALVLIVIGGLMVWADRMFKQIGDMESPFNQFGTATRVSMLVLGLFFLTVETWDHFDRSLELERLSRGLFDLAERSLRNMQQLTLSAVWLAYSAIMLILGIWRRRRPLRTAAIVLFGVTIVKIFFWDLTFLTGLYRIFSFIGLGIILLAASFAYQKFRKLIFGEDSEPVKSAS
jgi:hypothetical protein